MKFYWKHKERGQSIPIIAMMIVILFAMVGLSVDVGNTYAEQRNVVRATDAAALAGMQKMLQQRQDKQGDAVVAQIIKSSLKSNGLLVAGEVAPETRNQRQVNMSYLDAGGNKIDTCEVGGCTQIPNDAKYIKVETSGVVDTYFARVVNRSTLPVGSTAYAAYCAPKDNVFPLAVSAEAINGERFKQLDSSAGHYETAYSPSGDPNINKLRGDYKEDAQYSFALNGITWRKLFLSTQIGKLNEYQARVLSWKAANRADSGVLQQSFAGVGTMADGITEAPWPENVTPDVPKPDGYPINPSTLDQDEWLINYASSTNQISTNELSIVADALQKHAANRDTLILPIVGTDEAPSSEHSGYRIYRSNKLGLFRIANNGQSDGGVRNHGAYMTVDLAYLGDIAGVACLQTPAGGPSENPPPPPAVVGEVQVKPTNKVTTSGRPPIAYQVVMDVSGSMVMDMNGNAYRGTNPVFCLDPSSFTNISNYPVDSGCIASGDQQKWEPKEDRRIYIAKDAVRQMIDGMETSDPTKADTMRVIAFSKPEVNGGAIANGQTFQIVPTSGWSSDKNVLKSSVTAAGSYNGDPYLSTGSTPTPDGLNQVLKMLQSTDMPKTAPNGDTYKRVVVLITDGMANVFLGKNGQPGVKNDAYDICGAVDPHSQVYNMVKCQQDTTADGQLRPLDAMVERANAIKSQDPNLQLWVIGMSRVNPYGLENGVASNSSMYIPADKKDKVYEALQNIQTAVETGKCTTKSENDYRIRIDGGNKTSTYPDDTYGYVTITDATGNIVPDGTQIPIRQDPTINGGKLSWYIPPGKLPPGTYTIIAEVGYKGTDGEPRIYKWLDNGSSGFVASTTFTVEARQFGDTVTVAPLKLNLSPEESLAICGGPDKK